MGKGQGKGERGKERGQEHIRSRHVQRVLDARGHFLGFASLAFPQSNDAALLDRARALLKQTPLIDGHNDYPWELREKAQRNFEKLDIAKPQPTIMTDIARLRAGGVGGQFWSVYVPVELTGQSAVTATLEEIDTVHQMTRRYPRRSS
jgi:membrane dipeptidase